MTLAPTAIEQLLGNILDAIDIPRSHYERAVKRYQSLGEWLCRDVSTLRAFNPAVSAQGSFRLGTVNRPLLPDEEYDLDTVCTLTLLTKLALTQQELKTKLGYELELYRQAYNIQAPLEERNRCWRMEYQDEISFHLDCLACIPEDAQTIAQLISIGIPPQWAHQAIALTCKTHKHYKSITNDWPTSNPGGYADWFEERFRTTARQLREALVAKGYYASVEQVPLYALKTPLQQAIQWLKRHRDVMFQQQPDLKPVSIIITTLAASAYNGEQSVYECLAGILQRMPDHINPAHPRVPNPVNPGEDFADKWRTNPLLEQNFLLWHKRAARDLQALANASSGTEAQRIAKNQLATTLSDESVEKLLPRSPRITVTAPAVVISTPPKPWGR